ncbi:hypothetical protein TNIN_477181 [Trichonephila inaurata madagascariensis]|uniref:DUF5641 domain-containing protein n=1 Tax=Trichonephila inaurata madagascariensis TaxID=2747483 RepID=A0A8X6IIK9_9ARAC|nr:hypothetical protein TNIN_477181 [Trichonephila inaurata madagascariensis]
MMAWKVRVKNIMKRETDALGQKDNHSLVTSSSLRLPKIQFQQFSGELTDWLPHFNLRGWRQTFFLNPEKFSELESQPDNFETMVLGLIWNLKDDCLSCKINCQTNEASPGKTRPLKVGEVVVVENSLRNRTLWSLARVIQLIPGKDGHVRVARVKTKTGELVRPVQRLYNLELQEPEINLPKDLTDSVIRTRRGRKVTTPKRLTCLKLILQKFCLL